MRDKPKEKGRERAREECKNAMNNKCFFRARELIQCVYVFVYVWERVQEKERAHAGKRETHRCIQ